MLLKNIDSEQSCLIATLISAAIGFIVGFVRWPNDQLGRVSTVMAARYAARYGSNSAVGTLPLLPRGIFFSLLAMAIPFIRGTCSILPGHIIFVMALAVSGLSSGTWLLTVLTLQSEADAQRKKQIEDFISSAPGSEPVSHPYIEEFPVWLRAWEGANCAAYLLIMATILLPFLRSPST